MKEISKKLLLSTVTLLGVLFLLEGGARIVKGMPIFYFRNFVVTRIDLLQSVFPTQHHPGLGWIPKPGDYSDSNYWGTSLTIKEHGLRSGGDVKPSRERPVILAVGDSFTFGSQVGNEETWPAVLSRLTGVPVINGGVFAYGFDQIVLRAEQLAPLVDPDVILISFIPDDINRTERSMRTGVPKPYFDIVSGELELRNVPVPLRPKKRNRIGAVRRVLGYSYLVDALMRRGGLAGIWYLGDWKSVRAHERGDEVACLLMQRLVALGKEQGAEVILLAQYQDDVREWYPDRSRKAVACARQAGLRVIDLYPDLQELSKTQPERFAHFFKGHMTSDGNAFVAECVARYLQARKDVKSAVE